LVSLQQLIRGRRGLRFAAACVSAGCLVGVVLGVRATPGNAGSLVQICGTRSGRPATFVHVIWIWMENHSYGQIIGSPDAPHIDAIAHACGLATNYRAVSHPSLPNYIAATSGGTWDIADDDPPSAHPLEVDSIFEQARSSRSYEESMPSNCDQASSGEYAVKHNPEAYYTRIRAACRRRDVPLRSTSSGSFARALRTGRLPAFSFVTPNLCHDMHDCSPRVGDAWLARWVSAITASASYRYGSTVLFITWDENDGSVGNQVAAIVVSPFTPAGTRSGEALTHYSLLRTTEDLLGIRAHLGRAARASSMRSAFGL